MGGITMFGEASSIGASCPRRVPVQVRQQRHGRPPGEEIVSICYPSLFSISANQIGPLTAIPLRELISMAALITSTVI